VKENENEKLKLARCVCRDGYHTLRNGTCGYDIDGDGEAVGLELESDGVQE
jgi:hypothetical protein